MTLADAGDLGSFEPNRRAFFLPDVGAGENWNVGLLRFGPEIFTVR
jgi:hypothetical protein